MSTRNWNWSRIVAAALLPFLLAGCQKEETPLDPVAEAEKAAPAAVGEPTLTLYFDPSVIDASPAERNASTQLGPDGRAAANQLVQTAQSQPAKILLITAYYDEAANPKNDLAYARQRAATVRNYLSSEGMPEARIAVGPPRIAARSANPADAVRVELRLQ